jgi:osmotically inducible lipoprotein OsmB
MMQRTLVAVAGAVLSLLMAACQPLDRQTGERTLGGAGVGAATGAAIGLISGKNFGSSLMTGAAAGAAGGFIYDQVKKDQ